MAYTKWQLKQHNKTHKKQMNKFFLTLIFFYIINFSFSQNKEERINEIKKMYAEVNDRLKKPKECVSNKIIEYEGFDENSEKFPFDQFAEVCKLNNNYKTLSASFNGYEWNCNMSYYLKNDIPFFVLMSTGAEGCISEYRIYLDINGEIIKLLEKSNDCDGNSPKTNKEVINENQLANIKKILIENKEKIDEIIKIKRN